MSQEMAEKKKQELENLALKEEEVKKEMENDKCPLCGSFTQDFAYIIMLPAPMGWLECPNCGTVFCPESLRRRKLTTKRTSILEM